MSIQSLSTLLAAIVTFVIGWSIILRDRRRRQYVSFSLLCFNLCLWYLASFFSHTLHHRAFFWLSLAIALAIPSNAERFFRAFLAEDPRRPKPISPVTLLLSWLFYLLLGYSAFFHPLYQSKFFTIPIFAFIFGSLYHCVYLIYARQHALRSRPESTRLTYLLIGGAATITLAATDFLPRTGLGFPTLGNILTIIYMYFISQTLFHYRLLDIKELLGKMVTLSILVCILTIFYGLLLAWVGRDRPGVFFFNTIVASFVILVIFEQLKAWVEDRINHWMFREKYEFSRRLQLLRHELANIIEVQPLVTRILRHLEQSERVTHASIYLADPSGVYYRLAGHLGPQPIDQLEGNVRLLFLERLKDVGLLTQEGLERELLAQTAEGQEDAVVAIRNLLSTLDELKAGVCIPMILDNQLLGLFNLRDDRLREAYASEELDELRSLAAQAAITLRNSKVYEKMKERDRLAALGQMAAGLAHEIRNPLSAIKGAAQLLKDQPQTLNTLVNNVSPSHDLTGESDEYIDIIVEEVNRLDRVVSQFLGYARPDRGERQTLSINDVVHKTIQLLIPQSGEVEIKTDLASDLAQVRADPEQLRQVFLNLGINAIQAMQGKGTLLVVTRGHQTSKPGEVTPLVEICFQDTGIGIPPEAIQDIFIPFYTTKEGGTGLGLPICQRIIENHKGTIEVRSQPGRGSAFSVLLPV